MQICNVHTLSWRLSNCTAIVHKLSWQSNPLSLVGWPFDDLIRWLRSYQCLNRVPDHCFKKHYPSFITPWFIFLAQSFLCTFRTAIHGCIHSADFLLCELPNSVTADERAFRTIPFCLVSTCGKPGCSRRHSAESNNIYWWFKQAFVFGLYYTAPQPPCSFIHRALQYAPLSASIYVHPLAC